MKTGGLLLLFAVLVGVLCCILSFGGAGNDRSPKQVVVVNAPESEASLPRVGSASAPLESGALPAIAATVSTQNVSAREGVATTKSVDSEHRDSVWANPTERDLREQARRIPGIDDGSIITRCASTVCDLIVHVSAYASPDDQRAFTKYVTGDALPISLTNTNALIGDVRMSNYDGRLTATMSLDRIHR